ncbi:Uncharacterised protein [Porphyromonas crevioricanis]|uniref:Uncharacterized protein n=1 Tax=Porphyromonas crevioricanis TaxID=393921 RepID=A0A2X4PNJ9_9PORP|nr:Uncharacterised protein [Porphyromonas crevioricanis]
MQEGIISRKKKEKSFPTMTEYNIPLKADNLYFRRVVLYGLHILQEISPKMQHPYATTAS